MGSIIGGWVAAVNAESGRSVTRAGPAIAAGAAAPATRTSSTFSSKTSQTFDGFHVKHYGMLSDEGTKVLVLLIRLILALARMPPSLELVLATLIPKAKGGFRAIGLFPSLYRVVMRILGPLLRSWERESTRNHTSLLLPGSLASVFCGNKLARPSWQ